MQHSVIDANDLQILILIAISLLVSPYIAKFLRLPISATEMLLGSILAYFALLPKSELFNLVSNIGFCYLMFMAGMEVNLKSFFSMKKSLAKRSFIYISSLYILSSLLTYFMGLSYIFIIIFPVMSVGLLSMLFKDFGKNSYWLNTAMIVATLAEVISIILLTIVGTALKQGINVLDIFINLLYLFSFLCFCLLAFKLLRVLFWWYPQIKNILMPIEDNNEKDIRLCISVFILITATMFVLKLDVALGSFIAGSFVATFFNHKADLEKKLSSFAYGLLIPVFFIYTGSTFNLSLLTDINLIKNTIFIVLAMIGIRLLSSLAFYDKFSLKQGLLFALSHSMPLTLLVATATLSYNAKLIDTQLYSALILSALFEAILVMSLIKLINSK